MTRLEELRRVCWGNPAAMRVYRRLCQEVASARGEYEQYVAEIHVDAFISGFADARAGRPCNPGVLSASDRAEARSMTLRDGSIGYFSRRDDDCFGSALATCLQVDIAEVPDAHIDERLAAGEAPEAINASMWGEAAAWLEGRGLRMVAHTELPTDCPRWIGIIEMPGDAFSSHCLVMAHGQHIFNPSGLTRADGRQVRSFGADRVTFGLSFEELQNHKPDEE